jgi:hypothetical protein
MVRCGGHCCAPVKAELSSHRHAMYALLNEQLDQLFRERFKPVRDTVACCFLSLHCDFFFFLLSGLCLLQYRR